MLSYNICRMLCYFPEIVEPIPAILGPFHHFLAACRMAQGVRTFLVHSFCSNLRIRNNVAKPFSTSGICFFFKKVLCFLSLGFYALWGKGSSKEFNLCSTKNAFVHCQLKACLLDAFES